MTHTLKIHKLKGGGANTEKWGYSIKTLETILKSLFFSNSRFAFQSFHVVLKDTNTNKPSSQTIQPRKI